MTEFVVQGVVKPDGTLQLNEPVNLPPGEVRVVVQVVEPAAKRDLMGSLERIWAERRALGMQGRTAAQIDNGIRAMREEWEDRQAGLDADRAAKE